MSGIVQCFFTQLHQRELREAVALLILKQDIQYFALALL